MLSYKVKTEKSNIVAYIGTPTGNKLVLNQSLSLYVIQKILELGCCDSRFYNHIKTLFLI